MYGIVFFRYPGGGWQQFSEAFQEPHLGYAYKQARAAHPTAQLGVIEGYSLADVHAKVQLLAVNGQLAPRDEGPQGVPPSEAGPGGDVNTPYTGPVLPNSWPVVSAWATLAAKVQRGELGGANDGAIRLGPSKEEEGAA